jgi:hypothetical protein
MEIGELLAQFLSGVVFPLVTAIVLALVGIAARKLDKKFDVEISRDNLKLFEALARNAANFAEERAATWAKAKQNLTSSEKMDEAIKWMLKQAPTLTEEQARDFIEAVLPGELLGATNVKRDL